MECTEPLAIPRKIMPEFMSVQTCSLSTKTLKRSLVIVSLPCRGILSVRVGARTLDIQIGKAVSPCPHDSSGQGACMYADCYVGPPR